MSKIRRSLAYSVADSYLSLLLQLVGTMVISRLLQPAEIGVFAVAAVFAAFASTFRDFGVAEYLIQEKNLAPEHIRAALSVNIAISWAMAAILLVAAPFVGDFYREPGVMRVMQVQALNFAIIPFGAVTMAYFRREMNFRPIFIASLLSGVTTFVVSIVCAFQGFAYMSLAWSSLAGVGVTVLVSIWFRPADFPRWPGLRGIRRVINFGKFASGIYLLGQLGKGAPEMIIGRAQDMVGVALFSRGSGLVEIFNKTVLRAVMPVCLPYFAKSNREQGSVVSGYLASVSYLTAIGWPFLFSIGVLAWSAIRIIYGPQWSLSVPVAQILCAVGAIELVHYLAKEALLAVGEVKRANNLQLVIQASRIAGLCAVIPFGLSGAGWGLLGAAVLGTLYSQWILGRALALDGGAVIATCRTSLFISLFSSGPLALWVAVSGIDEDNYLHVAVLGGVLTISLWLLALRLFGHPLWSEICGLAQRLMRKLPAGR